MKRFFKIFYICFFVLFCLLSSVFCHLSSAAVPHLINYQGRLTDISGLPLNGLYNLTFRVYDAETAGTLLWQGTYSNTSITKGIFNILLGDVNDTGYNFQNLAFDKPYWLEIKVNDEVMTPRQRITSAGYTIRAEKAEMSEKVEGTVKAINGLTIETRNSDPNSPTTGQIWLRTDL